MSEVTRMSALTLIVKNMEKSCSFYSNIPGFKLIYGGSPNDSFTTYELGKFNSITCLNLEQMKISDDKLNQYNNNNNFGRVIFHTNNVDRLYAYFKNNKSFSKLIFFENEPVNAPWNERYFHLRDPDGFQLSFAQPFRNGCNQTKKQ